MLESKMIRGKNIFKRANIFVGNTEYITWKDNWAIFSIDGQKIISAKIFLKVRTFLNSVLNITYNSKKKDLELMT